MHFDPSVIAAALARQDALQALHRFFAAIDAGKRRSELPADVAWREWDAGFGGAASHHQVTNTRVTLTPSGAAIKALLCSRYRRPTLRGSDTFVALSDLRARLEQIGGEWRIASLAASRMGAEGNPGVISRPGPASAHMPPTVPLAPEPPPASDAEAIRRVLDRDAIEQTMLCFGRALDTKDWPLYRACLADELTVDFAHTTGQTHAPVSADRFVEFVAARQRRHASFHQYSNFQCRIEGDRARCILYLVARHRMVSADGDPLNVFVGWYDNDFVRTSAGWKVARLSHPLQWVEGNASIKDAPDPEADALAAKLFGPAEAA